MDICIMTVILILGTFSCYHINKSFKGKSKDESGSLKDGIGRDTWSATVWRWDRFGTGNSVNGRMKLHWFWTIPPIWDIGISEYWLGNIPLMWFKKCTLLTGVYRAMGLKRNPSILTPVVFHYFYTYFSYYLFPNKM